MGAEAEEKTRDKRHEAHQEVQEEEAGAMADGCVATAKHGKKCNSDLPFHPTNTFGVLSVLIRQSFFQFHGVISLQVDRAQNGFDPFE